MKVIYAILNKVTNYRYIGSAINFYDRKRRHLSQLRKKEHHSILLQRAWDKYGEDNFEFIILENVETKELLIPREQWWLDNTPNEYNICKIAGNSLGVKRRAETKERVRLANLGLKHPEWRNNIKSEAQGGENHWQYGKKMPNHVKDKKSKSMKIWCENHVSHRKGVRNSDEAILEMRKKLMIPIIQLDLDNNFIKEWESAKTASNELKIWASNIAACLKKKKNKAGNFKWVYKTEYYE